MANDGSDALDALEKEAKEYDKVGMSPEYAIRPLIFATGC